MSNRSDPSFRKWSPNDLDEADFDFGEDEAIDFQELLRDTQELARGQMEASKALGCELNKGKLEDDFEKLAKEKYPLIWEKGVQYYFNYSLGRLTLEFCRVKKSNENIEWRWLNLLGRLIEIKYPNIAENSESDPDVVIDSAVYYNDVMDHGFEATVKEIASRVTDAATRFGRPTSHVLAALKIETGHGAGPIPTHGHDKTLLRLQTQYAGMLKSIVVPEGGFTTQDEAKAGTLLDSVYRRLVARQKMWGLEPETKAGLIGQAKSASEFFYARQRASKLAAAEPSRPSVTVISRGERESDRAKMA